MPFNGAGVFTPLSPEYPAISGAVIFADDWNSILEDIASGLSMAMTTDGQATPTADLTMGGFKLINLAAGVAPNDSVRFVQVFTSPNFSAPTAALPNPATSDNSQLLATDAWVQSRLMETISYTLAPSSANYGNDLITSKWVKDLALSPMSIPPLNVFSFQNF